MDATEAAALTRLGERELWGVDELPDGIDADMLRCLDLEGLVEARGCWMQNQQTHPDDSTLPSPACGPWCSPLKHRDIAGEWDMILQNRARDQWHHPYEVRVSERGRAELARTRRFVRREPDDVESVNRLSKARDTLFDAARKAERLAELVERLEARYTSVENPNPDYFYVPTDVDDTWGCRLDPDWTDHAPPSEHRLRREAIDATLALRASVDSAMDAVSGIAACMNSDAQSVDQWWTTRTIGQLRKLRGAIVLGHGADMFPSAMPMIRAGVPVALREHWQQVHERMEEVKSALVAGVQPRKPTPVVPPDLVDILKRITATTPLAGTATAKPVAKRATDSKKPVEEAGIDSTGVDWKVIQDRLLAKRARGEPYTSLRKLAAEFGCSDSTIKKAIYTDSRNAKGEPTGASAQLKGWKKRHERAKAAPKATDLEQAVTGTALQMTKQSPDLVLPDDDVDAVMNRLIAQANPAERAKLNALDPAGRRALVEVCQAQNLDDEPSPVETDKPGRRFQPVRQHKRA